MGAPNKSHELIHNPDMPQELVFKWPSLPSVVIHLSLWHYFTGIKKKKKKKFKYD